MTPELLERRILAIGVDPGVIPRIIEAAAQHGVEPGVIVEQLERLKALSQHREELALDLESLKAPELPANIFELKALPRLVMSSTPPPRRASKRAQRSKHRPWAAR